MKRSIILTLVETNGQHVAWTAPAAKTIGERVQVADAFGLEWHLVDGRCFPLPTEVEADATADQMDDRIKSIARRNRIRVVRLSKTSWKATMDIRVRKTHHFPTVSGNATKWGAVDFYDDVRNKVSAAVQSGLDFDTDWLSCKKEPVSCRISREKGVTSVEVSVFGEEEAYGNHTCTTQLHKHLTEDQIMARLEKAAYKAQHIAEQDLREFEAFQEV